MVAREISAKELIHRLERSIESGRVDADLVKAAINQISFKQEENESLRREVRQIKERYYLITRALDSGHVLFRECEVAELKKVNERYKKNFSEFRRIESRLESRLRDERSRSASLRRQIMEIQQPLPESSLIDAVERCSDEFEKAAEKYALQHEE